MPSQRQIREAILKGRGLRLDRVKNANLPSNNISLSKDKLKNNSILYIESLTKQKIEDIIWSDSIPNVSKRLDVTTRTISRWRVKFPKCQ